jgi:hypothetical protein
MCGVSIEETITSETVVVSHMEESSITIVFPVSNTVANHETLEVGSPCTWSLLVSLINPLIDSKSKLRHVNASI